ncbi:hypothetical protein QL285_022860 [Trifolium repens]|nr:hypothetical protein QL285_022860 [Trifolium repens]
MFYYSKAEEGRDHSQPSDGTATGGSGRPQHVASRVGGATIGLAIRTTPTTSFFRWWLLAVRGGVKSVLCIFDYRRRRPFCFFGSGVCYKFCSVWVADLCGATFFGGDVFLVGSAVVLRGGGEVVLPLLVWNGGVSGKGGWLEVTWNGGVDGGSRLFGSVLGFGVLVLACSKGRGRFGVGGLGGSVIGVEKG